MMKLTELLNPATDEPMDDEMHVSVDAIHITPVHACGTHISHGVLVVETQVEDSLAAHNLIMLGTKDKPELREAKISPFPGMHQEFARSPVLHSAQLPSFHMSPMALKTGNAASMWGGAMPIPIKPATMPSMDVVMHSPSCSSPLKRRISSISSMLSEASDAADGIAQPVEGTHVGDRPDYCSVTGCLRRPSQQNLGKCAVHKGMKLCQIDGCFRPVQSRGCCKSHGGGARCKHPDCTKGAISKGRCRSHGGGTRCAIPECPKWAQRFGCCVRHSKSVNPRPPIV